MNLNFLSSIIFFISFNSSAIADSFIVNNTNNSGPNSLREAIEQSNSVFGQDTIYINTSGIINLESSLPNINDNLVIIGSNPQLINIHRNSPDTFRIFTINSGKSTWIKGITISNGKVVNGQGGGIKNGGIFLELDNCNILDNSVSGINNTGQGGGIFSIGTLLIQNCSIKGNSAFQSGGTMQDGFGGGIFSPSTVNISNCTFTENFATTSGGGLYNQAGNITITNSTFYNNYSEYGGGLINDGILTLKSCTIANNTATGSGGGLHTFYSTTLNIENTIVADNNGPSSSPDISGTITSQGNNLIGNTTGATILGTPTGNLLNISPLLDSLSNNGGQTFTVALLSGSPAIDAANSNAPIIDQRGFFRDTSPDIGSFEYGAEPPIPVELTSFNASIEGKIVFLIWSTATEVNNKGFEIERSINDTWGKITFISGMGTTTRISNYSYTDNLPAIFPNNIFIKYRLKQIDHNGSYIYSDVISLESDLVPDKYSLSQNYPNPFNPNTRINYSIPERSFVIIKVYNLLGKEIATLVNEEKAVGNYEVEFSADNHSSGVYFYKIQAKGFTDIKKFILMK